MTPKRIAVTGGRGRLAPFVATRMSELDSAVVCFSRSAGDGFQELSLLTEPRALADFDALLHLAWSTVPLTSEEKPGREQATDLPLLKEILECMRRASTAASACFLFDGGRLRKHQRPRNGRNSLQPPGQLCPCQAARGGDHPSGVRRSPRSAMLYFANIKCLRFDRCIDETPGHNFSHLPRGSR